MTPTLNTPRQALFTLLDALRIAHETVDHPAVFTVDEGRDLKASMPGGHSKNLFLRDKKGGFTLVTAWCDTRVDLVGLAKATGAKGRFSFAKPDRMTGVLGVIPGAVTPFALINARDDALQRVVVDRKLLEFDRVWFHPLENTASTALMPDDLLWFIRHCGYEPLVLDLAAPSAREPESDI